MYLNVFSNTENGKSIIQNKKKYVLPDCIIVYELK